MSAVPLARDSWGGEETWVDSIHDSSVKENRGRRCFLVSPHVCMPFPAAAWGDFLPPASLQDMKALE